MGKAPRKLLATKVACKDGGGGPGVKTVKPRQSYAIIAKRASISTSPYCHFKG